MSTNSRFTVSGVVYPLNIQADDVPKSSVVFVTERHMPGGNINYLDLGGSGLPHLVLSILFRTPTKLIAFEATYGKEGVLTNFDGHTYRAVIGTGPRRTAHGASAGGESVVQVDFTLLEMLT